MSDCLKCGKKNAECLYLQARWLSKIICFLRPCTGQKEFKAFCTEMLNSGLTLFVMFVLTLLSVIATFFELLLPDGPIPEVCGWIAWVLTPIFLLELAGRFYIAENIKQFLKDCWMDIIAIIPVTRSLRILRLLRLLRLVSLGVRARRQHRLRSFGKFFSDNIVIITVPLVGVLAATIAISITEAGQQPFSTLTNAFWWAVSTITAGEPIYGEPSTFAGKLIAFILMLGGVTIFAVFTGLISAYMVRLMRDEVDFDFNLIKKCHDHYVICGWNQMGHGIVKELQASKETGGKDIIVVTEDDVSISVDQARGERGGNGFLEKMARVARWLVDKPGDLWTIQADYTSADILRKVQVNKANSVIVLASDEKTRSEQDRDARSILTSLTVEKMGKMSEKAKDVYSCVQLINPDESKKYLLERAGVEDMIDADEFVGHLIAHSVLVDGLIHILQDLLTSSSGFEFSVVKNDQTRTFSEALKYFKQVWGNRTLLGYSYGNRDKVDYVINPQTNVVLAEGVKLLFISPTSNEKHSTENDGACCDIEQKNILVCGWSNSVPRIIKELCGNVKTCDMHILHISELEYDQLPYSLKKLQKEKKGKGKLKFITGDYTSTEMLERAGVSTASHAVIVADKTNSSRSVQDCDARVVLAALTIEKLNPQISTTVELMQSDADKESILKDGSVESVICGDDYVSNLIAQATRVKGLGKVFKELLTSNERNEFKKINISEESAGKTYGQVLCEYWEEHKQIVVGISKSMPGEDHKWKHIVNPEYDSPVEENDQLFVISR